MNFLQKIKFKYEINASSILYHYTSNTNAGRILHTDRFKLSAPERAEDKGYYFLSTSRAKFAGYHLNKRAGTIFVLDGDLLGKKYKKNPINFFYFNPSTRKHYETEEEDEMEERILSSDSQIKNAHKYIKEIHILAEPAGLHPNLSVVEIINLAEKRHIPYYLYDNYNILSWLNLNKRKANQSKLAAYAY